MTYTPYYSGQQATQVSKDAVIIVEDNPSNAEVLVFLLQSENTFQTLCFRDGTELLEYVATLNEFRPKLLLLDYILPHMTALTLYDRLQSFDGFEHIPTIILTAHIENALERQIDIQRNLTLVPKPYDIDILLSIIQQIIK